MKGRPLLKSDVKAELRKYGIPVDDIAEFAKTVRV
jgi:hypothetical protein